MNAQTVLKTVYTISKKSGVRAYVVGGYVRDDLIGTNVQKDIDIVIEGSGVEFAKQFSEKFSEEEGSLILFPEFDTARYVFLEREKKEIILEIEFAGARAEAYHRDSRKPTVQTATLEEDLSRRDFTVNAMARKIGTGGRLGKIIDPFFGQESIGKKELKTPLNPNETFSEDPLRMLRAARFAAQLHYTIEPKTKRAMKDNAQRLAIVSKERIEEELLKLLGTPEPSVGLWLLSESNLFTQFIPEINALAGVEEVFGYSHKDNLSHTFAVVDNIAEQSDNRLLRFAGLMHDIAKPQTKKFVPGRGWTFDMHEHLGRKMTKEICRRLKMSKDDTLYVSELVRWHLQPIALMDEGVTDTPVRRLVVNLGDRLHDLLMLCRADITTGNQKKKERRLKNYDILEKRIAEVLERDKLRAFQSPVRGEEIMELSGLKPGPTVGKIKEEIERAILDGEIPNEYEAAKTYFEKVKEGFLQETQEWERR